MKIITTTRVRNESKNIERFCKAYWWVDKILIADGGSEDNTLLLANQFPNVKTENFKVKIYGENNLWRNPHGRHMNFLFTWAKREGADWIIFDDCDCVPTTSLQNNARLLFETIKEKLVFAYRLYVYGENQYFPRMNDPGKSIWAWRSDLGIYASEKDPWVHRIEFSYEEPRLELEPPLALLHFFAPNEDEIRRKMNFYKLSGQHPDIRHPKEYGGEIVKLPTWAKYE
ncbi:hypothetical protein AYK26_07675 [Euryarchaeota archaeon SM23-78]|nr:MAG: hypothetical protein AYK26_07675 [Euryarchaeota archaeon SM23-78]